jgi:hypothetical protein
MITIFLAKAEYVSRIHIRNLIDIVPICFPKAVRVPGLFAGGFL